MKLSKFPVTAPDGTEYRVSITEHVVRYFGKYAKVTVYSERRKRGPFRFKKLLSTDVDEREGFNVDDPDYIALAWIGIGRYVAYVSEAKARERRRVEAEARRTVAAEAFTKWDGKIAE